jgi:CDP-glucose 4,6-dehydratase
MEQRQSPVEIMGLVSHFYQDKTILVTGHTGFKGSWLCAWLHQLGAKVSGLSLNPATAPNHWDLLNLKLDHDIRADIEQANELTHHLHTIQPEIIFHLAAQSLVRESYQDPIATWSTNVMGTAHLLESCRTLPLVKAIVIVTSDKCYDNKEKDYAYTEQDSLGGFDPYSASKAATELVAHSFRKSFFSGDASTMLLATARAGNVIGGGDWCAHRLIPDAMRALTDNQELVIRYPQAVRPWQHVCDPLYGYMLLAKYLYEGRTDFATAWNFGPDTSDTHSVEQVLSALKRFMPDLRWTQDTAPQPHEAHLLQLDSSKARAELGWTPRWNFSTSIEKTAQWYDAYYREQKILTSQQIQDWMDGAQLP